MVIKLLRHRFRILIFAAITLAGAGAFVYLNGLSSVEASETTSAVEAESDDATPVTLADIALGPISSYLTTTTNLVPEHQVDVLAETTGRLARVLVEEGDQVTAGEVLAVLVQDEVKISGNKALLRARNASMAFDRARGTLDQGLIAREEFDRLEMEHEVAQQEVAEAEWKLSRTVIKAPFGGHITQRSVHPGQHLRPGDRMFTLADFSPLIAPIYLPEQDVLQLGEGGEVRISLAADSSFTFAGVIRRISPVVDTATGTVKVTVKAIDPPTQVRPGAFVSVDIVRQHRSSTVLVPREAVVRELRSAHVFVITDHKAVKQSVTLGIEEGNLIEALSGVEPGQQVVVAGHGGLRPGSKVKIL